MQLPLTVETRQKQPPNEPSALVTSAPAAEPEPVQSVETDALEVETPLRTHRRFDRAARLLGEPGLHRLMRSRVLVIGVGGVGSFAAEALARSGVGHLTLIDFDKVCVTNTNRQLHTMKGTVGRQKVEVMAERLRLVHPTGTIEPIAKFYNAESSEELLQGRVDYVIDAIDNLTAKAHLVATCLRKGIPVVSSMGAAARLDPTQIRIDDLSETIKDPFARALRKILREQHGVQIERGQPVGVTAVFSVEEPRAPKPLAYDEGTGFVCVCPGGKNGLNDCDRKPRIDGTAAFLTGTFGLTAASVVVRRLSDN
ncbi:MAG TPA: tRNA threonylcarbamoyladenosine dehydratase [Polyangiaceae bacterium]|jgi:tRNA A37 threonylcarbamoyladenosine dehydratase|nr:tRNA threonylcarbamoyladenosine dehydratase [Polyangiaceae bacterium]